MSLTIRRPRERGDPYAVTVLVATGVCTQLQSKDHAVWVPAFVGTTREEGYFPIASAISPSVPTITRHHANSVKPWRVT